MFYAPNANWKTRLNELLISNFLYVRWNGSSLLTNSVSAVAAGITALFSSIVDMLVTFFHSLRWFSTFCSSFQFSFCPFFFFFFSAKRYRQYFNMTDVLKTNNLKREGEKGIIDEYFNCPRVTIQLQALYLLCHINTTFICHLLQAMWRWFTVVIHIFLLQNVSMWSNQNCPLNSNRVWTF